MEVKPTYLGTMIALATTAFGLLAAGAWNNAIAAIFTAVFGPQSGPWSLLVYAIVVTIIAIVVVQQLGKLADKVTPKT